ncbi:flavin reductase family protein [Streptomyces sp. NPDC086554]|uniref:flavin reductase family protein n=1 Tax=Streptomyces sp. NPDC086554 TaxID=3154864 RepID=UPI003439F5F8
MNGRRQTGPVEGDRYRTLMSGFPTGVAVVTGIDELGEPRGATCSALCSVTMVPPTVLVCLTAGSSTLAAVRERGWFALNLLHAGARTAAEVFSSPVDDRFARVHWKRLGPVGLPWLAHDAFAVAECRVSELTTVSTHTVVFGEVMNAELADEPPQPLLYGLRRFAAWPGEP